MITDFSIRMKAYEKASDFAVDKNGYVILRLDGHGFSKFTKGFKKPFDDRIIDAMVKTAEDLVDEFGFVTAFTQSDEISLLLPPSENMIFNGRMNKLLSLTSGFCSTRFNFHLGNAILESGDDVAFKKVGIAYFDSRIISITEGTEQEREAEAANTFLWRMKDCEKNSKNTFVQEYVSHKSCQGLTSNQLVEKCFTETGMDWYSLPEVYKYGTVIKKKNVTKPSPIDGSPIIRSETVSFPGSKFSFNQDFLDLILSTRIS